MATQADLKALHEQRGKIAADMKALTDAHFDQSAKSWKDKDKGAEWDKLDAEFEAVNAKHEEIRAAVEKETAEAEAAARRVENRLAQFGKLASDPVDSLIGRDGGTLRAERDHRDESPNAEDQALALQAWLGRDVVNLTDRHHVAAKRCGMALNAKQTTLALRNDFRAVKRSLNNTLSTLDGTKGGYTFGDTFVGQLETAMLAFGGILNVCDVIRTASGEPMFWPTADDTSNTGEIIGESVSVTGASGSGPDPTFSRTQWGSYIFSSKAIRVPFSLLQDSAFDLARVIADMLGERLGRRQATAFTTGNGASGPYGIVTRATTGVTTASATAITFDEIIDLEHSIDPSRRNMPGVGFMFHDNILKALKKLKDSQNRYLWMAEANAAEPANLRGYPYQISQDMSSTIVASATTALFGQLTAYKVRQVADVRFKRLEELYAESDEVAFLAFVRADGNLLDAGDHPVKSLVQHA